MVVLKLIGLVTKYLFLTLKMQQLSNLREFQSLNLNWKFDQFSHATKTLIMFILFTHFQTNKYKLHSCLNQIRKGKKIESQFSSTRALFKVYIFTQN